MCHVAKNLYYYIHFIYDYYKTAYGLYIYCTLFYYYILNINFRSEVASFLKIRFEEENMRKLCLKLKFHSQKEYCVFLLNSVLHNYIIISLQ